jgi:signal transduction histidine kinase/AmiR/NasT family two-component response regulator
MTIPAARPPVLVVEDESVVAMDLSACLTKLGYPVAAVVGRGEEAIELAERHRPGLVLMDIHLRGELDGIAAAERIHGELHIPVVFLTAYSDDATLDRARASQAFGYLIKPFEDREVEVAAQMALHRHGLETALRESQAQLDAILASIGDSVVATDAGGNVVFINRAAEALLGVHAVGARGRRAAELLPTSTASDGTLVLTRRAGPIPIEMVTAPFQEIGGRTSWSVTVLRDVSERRQAEATRHRMLIEQTARAAVEREHEHARLLLGVGAILGQSFEAPVETVFQAVADRLIPALCDHCRIESLSEDGTATCIGEAGERPPADRAGEKTLERAMVARGKRLGHLILGQREGGRGFDEADAILADELAVRCAMALDNRDLYRAAQQAIQVRDDFLSIASHELKTPLTGMVLLLDSLAARVENVVLDPALRQWIEPKLRLIISQSDRLNRLVEELLDGSRLVAGRLHLNLESVDLGQVVREVVSECESRMDGGSPALTLDIPGPVIGRWDRMRLEQIVYNLFTNALKYGQGKPIDVRTVRRDDVAVLTVTDRGIGIAIEDQDRIFDRFERAVGPGQFGGLGLGLFITRQVVEAMAGSVQVTSRLQEGSTFTVQLPLAGPRLPAPAPDALI